MRYRANSTMFRPTWCLLLGMIGAVFGSVFPAPAWAQFAGRSFPLRNARTAELLARDYPRTDLRIRMTIRFSEPGTVLDTVGIDAAPIGSWTVAVHPDRHLGFWVYDPEQDTKVKAPNGWHTFNSKERLEPNRDYNVTIEAGGGKLLIQIDDNQAETLALDTPLSGKPIYVGDYPNDAHWGEKHPIHRGMTGRVVMHYCGSIRDDRGAPPTSEQQDAASGLCVADARFKVPADWRRQSATPEDAKAGNLTFSMGSPSAIFRVLRMNRPDDFVAWVTKEYGADFDDMDTIDLAGSSAIKIAFSSKRGSVKGLLLASERRQSDGRAVAFLATMPIDDWTKRETSIKQVIETVRFEAPGEGKKP